jgi:hypothetical protein
MEDGQLFNFLCALMIYNENVISLGLGELPLARQSFQRVEKYM